MSQEEAERFWPKVRKTEGCWLWTSSLTLGYGVMWRTEPGTRYAHRLAYEELVGPIPKGMTIDHLCGVTKCVNPAHMEVVTRQENSERKRKARR